MGPCHQGIGRFGRLNENECAPPPGPAVRTMTGDTMKYFRLLALACLALVAAICRAQAGYPGKTVRIIIPYAAGGGVDARS